MRRFPRSGEHRGKVKAAKSRAWKWRLWGKEEGAGRFPLLLPFKGRPPVLVAVLKDMENTANNRARNGTKQQNHNNAS